VVLPKGPVSVPLLLGENMKKFECKVCGPKCVLISPDDTMVDPEYCPWDQLRARWRQVIRVEAVVSDGVASRL
jgi:hypothetical protein